MHAKSLQSCSTLCDPMSCSPPDSSDHGILQARISEWVACPSSGDFPYPGISLWPVLYYYFFNDINFIFIFKLYNIVLVLANIKMNPPQVYMCSPSWTLLPPHSIPLSCPSAPAPSIQYHALNLDWQLVSYMILYMVQCHSPKSTHPLPLPQSV